MSDAPKDFAIDVSEGKTAKIQHLNLITGKSGIRVAGVDHVEIGNVTYIGGTPKEVSEYLITKIKMEKALGADESGQLIDAATAVQSGDVSEKKGAMSYLAEFAKGTAFDGLRRAIYKAIEVLGQID